MHRNEIPYHVSQAGINESRDFVVSVTLNTGTESWRALLQNSNIALDEAALERFAQTARQNVLEALTANSFHPRHVSEMEDRQLITCVVPGETLDRENASHMIRDVIEQTVRRDVQALIPPSPQLAPAIVAKLKILSQAYSEGMKIHSIEEKSAVRAAISDELGVELPSMRERPNWLGDQASASAIAKALGIDADAVAIEKLQVVINETHERFNREREKAYEVFKREAAFVAAGSRRSGGGQAL